MRREDREGRDGCVRMCQAVFEEEGKLGEKVEGDRRVDICIRSSYGESPSCLVAGKNQRVIGQILGLAAQGKTWHLFLGQTEHVANAFERGPSRTAI